MFSKKMLDTLERIKLKLLLGKNLSFVSSLLATLPVEDITDHPDFKGVDKPLTACTDGIKLLINEKWFLSLSDSLQEMVLLHEAFHILKLHPLRGKQCEDARIRNLAFDVICNRDVIGLGYYRQELIDNGAVVLPQYEHMSEEEIYVELYKKVYNQAPNKNPDTPCTGGTGNVEKLLHNQGQALENMGEDVIEVDASQEPDKSSAIIRKVSEAVELAKSRGWEIASGIEQIIEEFIHPKLKWNIILRKFFTDLIPGTVRTWSRPNRRYPDVYRPSKDKERNKLPSVMVFIDSSGSVSDEELSEYISEIRYLHNKFKPKDLSIIEFDTQIRQEKSYKPGAKIESFKFVGRGGTDYQDVMNTIAQRKPTFALIFTDLYCNIPPKPECDTHIVWIRTGKARHGYSTPEYGYIIHYEDSNV